MSPTTSLLLTMTEIAALARVRRPVVSMWMERSAASDHPFPGPASQRGSQLLFDGNDVSRWLSETERGNNASANRDTAAHAAAPRAGVVRCRHRIARPPCGAQPIARRASDAELLDQADAADPDDTNLFSEIEAIPELAPVARGEIPAYERMLSAHRRDTSGETPTPVLSADGIHLVAGIARGLASAKVADTSVAELADVPQFGVNHPDRSPLIEID